MAPLTLGVVVDDVQADLAWWGRGTTQVASGAAGERAGRVQGVCRECAVFCRGGAGRVQGVCRLIVPLG